MEGRLGSFLLIRDTNVRDTEEFQGAAVERPGAPVLLVTQNRSVPRVGACRVGRRFDQRHGRWFGKVHHVEVNDCRVQSRRMMITTSEAQGCQGSR